jgi:ribonuclease E
MTKMMLIDAAHPEETRVVVLNGHEVEAFDFESQARKQLRGNIYLAKVTRVEPSLQAAFVEYGGNRHGFLAFNEIHPDYYQIPHADREALLREAEEDDDEPAASTVADEDGDNVGGDDEDEIDEEVARRRRRLMRRYKIQEVIKRRQIMLVQVVKEERGNKGAALTTYLSLAGRYCVLMPNTDRGGGISRKITTATDRKRLKSVVQDLDVPRGMGLIVRTAGAKRTKAEIKRDYEYLSRAWGTIRDTTLHSIAPALIYEEEDLVKRAIRDLYDKDVDNVWVQGAAGYKEAHDFMRMLMPGQARKVQAYQGPAPLFAAYKIEDHLAQIYSPTVPLKSGGYLVINQTEALVAIDVNSGRATRERNIEATALKTNTEAAKEAARQLRLRDLAGLIVIDFIDMDEAKNNRAVEKVLKDCLAEDRARIQMGRISSFGLMELSRQRRRTGILEGTTHICPHCSGAGRVRSVESSALGALRAVEVEALKGGGEVAVRAPREVAIYLLNHKRDDLARMARDLGLFVRVVIDEALAQSDHEIERVSSTPHEAAAAPTPLPAAEAYGALDADEEDVEEEGEDLDEEEVESVAAGSEGLAEVEPAGRRGSRRRRRRGRRSDENGVNGAAPIPPVQAEEAGEMGRRRRGRRGGRKPREASDDVYGWSWPARLSGEDTYEWRGPVERAAPVEPVPAQPMLESPPLAPPVHVASAPAEATEEEVWVELPETAPPAKPRSRGRSRRSPEPRQAELAADVPDAALTEPTVTAEEPPVELETPAAEATPVVLAVDNPPSPDPSEIVAPPVAPRRGWWRRSV